MTPAALQVIALLTLLVGVWVFVQIYWWVKYKIWRSKGLKNVKKRESPEYKKELAEREKQRKEARKKEEEYEKLYYNPPKPSVEQIEGWFEEAKKEKARYLIVTFDRESMQHVTTLIPKNEDFYNICSKRLNKHHVLIKFLDIKLALKYQTENPQKFIDNIWEENFSPASFWEIQRSFVNGVIKGATHMLMVTDTWDWMTESEYVFKKEDVKERIKMRHGVNMHQVTEVYNLKKNMEEQMQMDKCYEL